MSDPRAAASAPSDAARIAAAVLTVDGVAGMSSGPVGQFRSYLPGGASVIGVRLDGDHLDLNVVARYGPAATALTTLGDAVAAALVGVVAVRTVTVSVDDIVLPGESLPTESADPAESVVHRPSVAP